MRFHRFFFVLTALSLVLTAPQPAFAKTHVAYAKAHVTYAKFTSRVAPADEYFGRLKMSILGIRNELRDLDQRLTYTPNDGAAVMGTAAFVEDAIRDWQSKYPADPWLPRTVYQLTHLYARVHSDGGHVKAVSTLHWLVTRYHTSPFCSVARNEVGSALK